MGLLDELAKVQPRRKDVLEGLDFTNFDIVAEMKRQDKDRKDSQARAAWDDLKGNGAGTLLTEVADLSPGTSLDLVFTKQVTPESVQLDILSKAMAGTLPSGASMDVMTTEDLRRKEELAKNRRELAAKALKTGELVLGEDVVREGGDLIDLVAPYRISGADLGEENTLENVKKWANAPAQPGTKQFTEELLASQSENPVDAALHSLAATDPLGAALARNLGGAIVNNPVSKTARLLDNEPLDAADQALLNISSGNKGLDIVADVTANLETMIPAVKALAPVTGIGPAMGIVNAPTRVEQMQAGQGAEAILGSISDVVGGAAIPKVIEKSVETGAKVAATELGQKVVAGGVNIAGQTGIGLVQQFVENPNATTEEVLTNIGTNVLLSAADTKRGVEASRMNANAEKVGVLGDVLLKGIGMWESRVDSPEKLASRTEAQNDRTKATGFAQMIPDNIRHYSKKVFGKALSTEEFKALSYEDQYKVFRSMSDEILAKHLDETNGDYEEAFRRSAAEWFGGPKGLKAWQSGKNPTDGGDYTSNYVEKVMANVDKLLGGEELTAADAPTDAPATATALPVDVGDRIGRRQVVARDAEKNTVLFDDGSRANADEVKKLLEREAAVIKPKQDERVDTTPAVAAKDEPVAPEAPAATDNTRTEVSESPVALDEAAIAAPEPLPYTITQPDKTPIVFETPTAGRPKDLRPINEPLRIDRRKPEIPILSETTPELTELPETNAKVDTATPAEEEVLAPLRIELNDDIITPSGKNARVVGSSGDTFRLSTGESITEADLDAGFHNRTKLGELPSVEPRATEEAPAPEPIRVQERIAPEAPVIASQEAPPVAPIAKERSARSLRAELKRTQLDRQPGTIRDAVLQYFAKGGQVDTEFTKREIGAKSKDFEYGNLSRLHVHTPDGPSWERIAEHMLQDYPELGGGRWNPEMQSYDYEISDAWKNEIVDVLMSHTTKTSMLEELAKRDPALLEQRSREHNELKRVVGPERVNEGELAEYERANEIFDIGGEDADVPPMLTQFMDEEGRVDLDSFAGFLRSQTVGKDFEDVPLPKEIYEQFDDFTRYLTSESAGFDAEDVRNVLRPFEGRSAGQGEPRSVPEVESRAKRSGKADGSRGSEKGGRTRPEDIRTPAGGRETGDGNRELVLKDTGLREVVAQKNEKKPRPEIVTASGRIVPKLKTEHVTRAKYNNAIDDTQHLNVNLTIEAYKGGRDSFLNGDGVGVGKTRENLVFANEVLQMNEGPVAIVMPKTTINGGSYQNDAAALGIDLGTIELASYDDVRLGKMKSPKYAAVIFDEAHNIRNLSAARTEAAESLDAKFRVYATATPFDKPEHAAVFLSRITNTPVDEMARKLGFEIVEKTDRYGQKVLTKNGDPVYEYKLLKGQASNWKEVYHNIISARNQAIEEGIMLRRELPFYGSIKIKDIELDMADTKRVAEVEDFVRLNPRTKTTFLNNALDHVKAKYVMDEIRDMREKGFKKIVIVSDKVSDDLLIRKKGWGPQADIEKAPSAFSQLRAQFAKDGTKYTEITGNIKEKDRPQAIRNFQEGDAEVALITYGTGGVGVNLDDIAGDAPRGMIIVSSDFSALALDQAFGRISRKNTKSPSEVRLLFAKNTEGDDHKRKIVEKKVRLLQAIQNGNDPDYNPVAAEIFNEAAGEGQTNEEGITRRSADIFQIVPMTDAMSPGERGSKTAKNFFLVRVTSPTKTQQIKNRLRSIVGADGKYLDPKFYSNTTPGKRYEGYKIDKKHHDLVVRELADEFGLSPEEIPDRDPIRDNLNSHQSVRDQNTLAMSVFGAAIGEKKAVRKGAPPKTFVQGDTPRVSTNKFEPLAVSLDPDVQASVEASRVRPKPPALEKVKETLSKTKAYFSRELEHLPNTAEFADVRARALELKKAAEIASDEVYFDWRGIYAALQPNEQVLMSDVLYRRDLAENIAKFREEGIPDEEIRLPHKHKSIAAFELDRQNFERALAENPRVAEAVNFYLGYIRKSAGENMALHKELGLHVPKLTRESYFRHVVTKFEDARRRSGGEYAKLTTKGWQIERMNTDADYLTSFVDTTPEVLVQMAHENAQMKFLTWIRDKYTDKATEAANEAARRSETFEGAVDGALRKGAIYEEVLDEMGLTLWSPQDSNPYFNAMTVPRNLVAEAAAEGLSTLENVPLEKVKQMIAVGGKVKFAVPKEVAAQLDDLSPDITKAGRLYQKYVMKPWKRTRLLDPISMLKYFERQVLSDVEKTAHNYKAFLRVPDAVHDLWDVYVNGKAPSESLERFMSQGGLMSSLDVADEIHVSEGLTYLLNEFSKAPLSPKSIVKGLKGVFIKFPNQAREFVDVMMRYANFKEYYRQIEADIAQGGEGRPENWGASHPDHVMSITGDGASERRAYKLSNDLIGAYDRITKFGELMARNVYPFYRWTEANAKAWMGLVANTWREYSSAKTMAEVGAAAAKSVARQTIKSPFTALRIGKFLLATEAMQALLQVWNNYVVGEDEEKLPERIKGHAHITLPGGYYLDRFSGIDDFTDKLGVTDIHHEFLKVMTGQKSFDDVIAEMAEHPDKTLERIKQRAAESSLSGFGPMQVLFELGFGKTLFPNPRKPRPIVDPWAHFLRGFGGQTAEFIYNKAKNIPQKSFLTKAGPLYHMEPGEAAMEDIRQLAFEFKKETTGKDPSREYSYDDKMRAAYYYRRALRATEQGYGDTDQIKHWALEYLNIIKSEKKYKNITDPDVLARMVQLEMREKLKRMDPLSSLSRSEQTEFLKTLTPEDRMQLTLAQQYFENLLDLQDEFNDRKKPQVRDMMLPK